MNASDIGTLIALLLYIGVPLACVVRVLLYLGSYLNAKTGLVKEQRYQLARKERA